MRASCPVPSNPQLTNLTYILVGRIEPVQTPTQNFCTGCTCQQYRRNMPLIRTSCQNPQLRRPAHLGMCNTHPTHLFRRLATHGCRYYWLSAVVSEVLVWPLQSALAWVLVLSVFWLNRPQMASVRGTVRIPCKGPVCISYSTAHGSCCTTVCNFPLLGSDLGTVHIPCRGSICIFQPMDSGGHCTTTCNPPFPWGKKSNLCKPPMCTGICLYRTTCNLPSPSGKKSNLCKQTSCTGIYAYRNPCRHTLHQSP